MDWFSWLSKTSLEPSLIYEYGLTFARNELGPNDLTYFDHEFLQSIGISVAKHRLEILKLARKEASPSHSGLTLAIKKANTIKNCITGLVLCHRESPSKARIEPGRYRPWQWRGAFTRKYKSEKELIKVEKDRKPRMIKTCRGQAKSGPLDRRVQEKLNVPKRLQLSGPLDGKFHERLVLAYKSPKSSATPDSRVQQGLIVAGRSPQVTRSPSPKAAYGKGFSKEKVDDDFGDDGHSLWVALFQDMKPT